LTAKALPSPFKSVSGLGRRLWAVDPASQNAPLTVKDEWEDDLDENLFLKTNVFFPKKNVLVSHFLAGNRLILFAIPFFDPNTVCKRKQSS